MASRQCHHSVPEQFRVELGKRLLILLFAASVLVSAPVDAQDMVPFVIPAKPNLESLIAISSFEPIDVRDDRIRAEDGHFYRESQRVRIWGVNLSFGANMPTHADAPRIAARLAAAGVNSVRCHHMDTSRWPRGLWNTRDGTTIEPEALDRLDFFIDQLARHGICVNINLHVGRAHSQYLGLPETNRQYDKISNIFTPALIDAQKDFARQLLGRVNPYRKVRYADDPAVAFVEVTNENSFFMWGSEETLRTLPTYYADILQNKFNAWLKERYGSDEKLRIAWSAGVEPLGANLLKNAALKTPSSGGQVPTGWHLEQHNDCRASFSARQYRSRNALRFEITKANQTEWHLQFNQSGLSVEAGRYYTVTFEAAADKPRKLGCGVSQAHEPWQNLGLSQQADLTQEWQTFRFGFVAKADDENARVSLAFGGSPPQADSFYLANVRFRPGGIVGLGENESIENGTVAVFADNEGRQRQLDRMGFLAETEKHYFDEMRSFIKNDLGCRALVTGTIVFGPLGLYAQSDMDFIDAHAYWQHPRFPGRPWDSGNWLVDQKPMVDYPEQSPMFRLAAQRLEGKPYTVSEYNHPAPLDSQAECVPMIASFGAAQDWDGIWFYTYSHGTDDWDREQLKGYFDIDANPAKWGFMRAGTAIFRDAGIKPFADRLVVSLRSTPEAVSDLAKLHLKHDRNMRDIVSAASAPAESTGLDRRLYVSLASGFGDSAAERAPVRLTWSVDNGAGLYMAAGGAGVLAGHTSRFAQDSAGYADISSPEYAVITATPLDGVPWPQSNRILITACGRCENTGMEFSKDRRTVGRQWGHAPVRIETVEGTVMVPVGRWRCQALGPDGTAKADVYVRTAGEINYVDMSAKYATMWYLLTRLQAESM